MNTVADTHRTNEENRGLKLPHRKAKLKQYFIKEAKRVQRFRLEFYKEPDLFDFSCGNTEMMKEFFNWLALSHLSIEGVNKVCLDRLSDPRYNDEEKKQLKREFGSLISFTTILASYEGFIDEKAYYYAGASAELEEVKKYRESKAQAN